MRGGRKWTENSSVLEEGGPVSTCALFSPQCRGLLRRVGDLLGTCAVKTHCRRSLRSGRGLSGACAFLIQHCRVYFATAPAWQLLERSRARQGRGPEGVRLWLFAPAPPSAALKPQVFLCSGYCANRRLLHGTEEASFCPLTVSDCSVC